ncbi:LigA [Burkholderia ambifaria IOP40-10]|uniref:LigA n=1 Tax=Burkholderia ambifaria IOP40-10 TaxID=396596 RepID=B1FQR1_9BURK|nr:LigA [Burkholderia ambifaria IOP40-10]
MGMISDIGAVMTTITPGTGDTHAPNRLSDQRRLPDHGARRAVGVRVREHGCRRTVLRAGQLFRRRRRRALVARVAGRDARAERAARRRYVDRRGRQRSGRIAGAGRRRRVPSPTERARAANRRHLYGRVRARRGRAARAAPRDDALGVRPRHAEALSGGSRRGRPDLYRRRADLDVGRDDGRPRPGPRDGGKGSRRPRGALGRAQARDASAPRRRPVTAFGNARSRAEIRPDPERAELCAPASRPGADRRGTGRRRPPESAPVQPRVHARNRAVAGEGDRAAAARGRAADDRAEPAFARRDREGERFPRPAPPA